MIRTFLHEYGMRILFIFICFALWGGYQSFFNYMDPFSLCHIDIRTQFTGSSSSDIKEAIASLQENDLVAYKNLCKYIEVINEKNCRPGDPRIESEYYAIRTNGCYVRGTHTIYITPMRHLEKTITAKERGAVLGTYANASAQFWNTFLKL